MRHQAFVHYHLLLQLLKVVNFIVFKSYLKIQTRGEIFLFLLQASKNFKTTSEKENEDFSEELIGQKGELENI